MKRPTGLEKLDQVLGFVSFNGDGILKDKLPNAALSEKTRRKLTDLAIDDYDWMALEETQLYTYGTLQAKWKKLVFSYFYLNGADDVLKNEKYKWSSPESRFITMGRPG